MGIVLFLLLCASLEGAKVLLMTDMYGTLQSPNFPDPYPKESELRWNISVPDGFQIKLYFIHFELEPSYLCEYDYVKLEAERDELALFCGRESSDTEQVPGERVITSPGSALSVSFHSDFSNEERFSGFEAHYSAVDVDECRERNDEALTCDHFCHNYIGGYYCSCRYGYQLHSDNRTCRVECSDNIFTERSGVVSSSNFPNAYPKSSDCLYRIQLEDGFQLTLEFDNTFDIEDHPDVRCPYDYIKIQAEEKEFGPFCGDRAPGKIPTGSNKVQVFFHSDNSGENIGWRLSYTSSGSQCPVPKAPLFGHLEPTQTQYTFKDHVLVTCNPGYRLLKDSEELEHYQIVCEKNGSWSSGVPQCKMVDCGPPGEVAMGEVVFDIPGNSTLYGSTFQYTCTESLYQIYPKMTNSTYTCGESGVWTNDELGAKVPFCQPACGEPSQPLPTLLKRIVGGRSAVPGSFPWQVLLAVEDTSRVPEGRWFGSGALLSDSWVLTVAHVLCSQRREPAVVPVAPEHVLVYLGLHRARSKHLATNRSVERAILHPLFDPRNYNNDIALLKLSERVPLGPLVRPVCLPLPQDLGPPPNTLGLVAGWGISNANSSTALTSDLDWVSDELQYVKLPVVEQGECEASYTSRSANYTITHNMFCAGFYGGGRDTCQGDSGGAFVVEDPQRARWVAQGLVSWAGPEECGSQRVYGVYTRLANYATWLQGHLGTGPWW